jgi:hypothetical protein
MDDFDAPANGLNKSDIQDEDYIQAENNVSFEVQQQEEEQKANNASQANAA